MRPKIINNCQKKYFFNAEKLLQRIISGIPEKYLEGLSKIILIDSGEEQNSISNYIVEKSKPYIALIEIDLSSILFRIPYCSTLSLNIFFLLSVNQHISKHLKRVTQDQDIQSFNTSKANFSWMNFGIWSPIEFLNNTFFRLFGKSIFYKKVLNMWGNIVIKNQNERRMKK